MVMWFLKIMRSLLAFIDGIVYWAVEIVYELFIQIASAGIFSQATIQTFASRVYAFLGLIMVFKVSISLVSYIMNPDNFSKNDVGAPALLKGFVFALVGIVICPYVFEMAYSLQKIVLEDNVIGNFILGMGSGTDEAGGVSGDYIKNGGKNMSSTSISAFYRLNTDIEGITEECAANPLSDGCSSKVQELFDDKTWGKFQTAYNRNPREVDEMMDGDILNATINDENGDPVFVMTYIPIVSTLVGGFIAYVLLLFCVDIAVRSVKLSFLQLIAPIPLISKIDPKKGDKVFNNWLKECTTTYLDVFLRLAAIYFALYIITAISGGPINMLTGEKYTGYIKFVVEVFLIIGCLNFARELPKLLGTILGIDFKGMGGFSLNPMKNKNFAPVGALAGLGSSIASGAARGARDHGSPFGKVFGGIGGALGGAVGGLGRNGGNLMAGKNWSDIVGAQNAYNRDMNLAQAQGSTPGTRRLAALSNAFGTPNTLDQINAREQELLKEEQIIEKAERDMKARVDARKSVVDPIGSMESRAAERIKNGQAGALSERYNSESELINNLRNMSGSEYENFVKAQEQAGNMEYSGVSQTDAVAGKVQALNDWMNSNDDTGAVSQYIDAALNNGEYTAADGTKQTLTKADGSVFSDGTLAGMYDDYVAAATNAGETISGKSGKALHDQSSSLKTQNSNDQRTFVTAHGKAKARIARDKAEIASDKKSAQAAANAANKGFTGGGK